MSILVLCLVLVSCSGMEEPRAKIYTEDQELEVVHLLDKKLIERELVPRLETVMVGKRFTDLPTLQIGDEVIIEATNFDASEFTVKKYILNDRASIVSDFETSPFHEGEFLDGKGTVMLRGSDDLERYGDYAVEGKSIVFLLFKSKIDRSDFKFGTIFLFEDEVN